MDGFKLFVDFFDNVLNKHDQYVPVTTAATTPASTSSAVQSAHPGNSKRSKNKSSASPKFAFIQSKFRSKSAQRNTNEVDLINSHNNNCVGVSKDDSHLNEQPPDGNSLMPCSGLTTAPLEVKISPQSSDVDGSTTASLTNTTTAANSRQVTFLTTIEQSMHDSVSSSSSDHSPTHKNRLNTNSSSFTENNNYSTDNAESSSQQMTEQQIQQFLTSNPNFLSQFVLKNVPSDEIINWYNSVKNDAQIFDNNSESIANQENIQPPNALSNSLKFSPNLHSPTEHPTTAKISKTSMCEREEKRRRASIQNYSQSSIPKGTAHQNPVRKYSEGSRMAPVCANSHPTCVASKSTEKVLRTPRKTSTASYFLTKTPEELNMVAQHQSTQRVSLSSGSTTPSRKISAQEFDRGELNEFPLIDTRGSFITEEEYHFTKNKEPSVEALDHSALMTELVKDIANELDNRFLYHKILQNLCKLTSADRASLYLVEGDKNSGCVYLVNAVCDVTKSSEALLNQEFHNQQRSNASLSNYSYNPANEKSQIKIPFGVGLIGSVAKSGETINIADINEDERFDVSEVYATSLMTPPDYKIKSVLCVPILNVHEEVIGVAQGINKGGQCNPQPFDCSDIRTFRTYLAFCGICLINARLYNRSRLESKRSKVLLEMAKCVFKEQSTVEVLVNRIMRELLNFLYCERCSVVIFESNKSSLTLCGSRSSSSNLVAQSARKPPYHEILKSCKTFHMSLLDLEESEAMAAHSIPSTCSPKAQIDQIIQQSSSRFPLYTSILEQCLQQDATDSMINLNKISQDPINGPILMKMEPDFFPESLLCSSIRNISGEIIGCVQLVNKPDVGFTKADEHFLEAFVIFCGLGISNTRTYEESVELSNKQRVAMEMLSYYTKASDAEIRSIISHASSLKTPLTATSRARTLSTSSKSSSCATKQLSFEAATESEINKMRDQVLESLKSSDEANYQASLSCPSSPKAIAGKGRRSCSNIPPPFKPDIYNFRLDELKLTEADTLSSALEMFRALDLINVLKTDEKTLVKWLITTKKNYRQVTYHNWRHAYSVCQLMFAILTTGDLDSQFDPLQKVSFLLATLSHDLDHRGTNNSFQKLIESPLAQLYSTSTLEHHHFDRFTTILSSGGGCDCNILSNLSAEEYEKVMCNVKHAIISTDLALYFQKREEFIKIARNQVFDINDPNHYTLLCSMLMTASDLGAITRPWHVQYQIANMIANEFFEQGDIEREIYNKDPIPMFDRNKEHDIPKLQLNFIDSICKPIYQNLAILYPSLTPLLNGLNDNREHWSQLAEKVTEPDELDTQSQSQPSQNTNVSK